MMVEIISQELLKVVNPHHFVQVLCHHCYEMLALFSVNFVFVIQSFFFLCQVLFLTH